MSFANSDFDTF